MEHELQTQSPIEKYLDEHGYATIEEAIENGANPADINSLLGIESFSLSEEAIALGGKVVEYNGL